MSGIKLNSQQVAYAGENFVAAEIHRRGGYAVTFSGNMKGIDLIASDASHNRKIDIQVKTKTAGTWQTTTNRGKKQTKPKEVLSFWILVDLRADGPDYYIMPTWWIENDIFTVHDGHRAKNDASTHHSIPLSRVKKWKDRWDVLGILPAQ
jgi:hypothetical protein